MDDDDAGGYPWDGPSDDGWDRDQAAADARRTPRLPELLGRASRGMASVVDEGLLLAGITSTQFQILSRNLSVGYAAVSELADDLGMAPATVSDVLRRLGDRGFVRRESSFMDSRIRGVRVTRAGAEHAERGRREVMAIAARAVRGLSAAEVGELERLLTVVTRNLSDERERRGLRRR